MILKACFLGHTWRLSASLKRIELRIFPLEWVPATDQDIYGIRTTNRIMKNLGLSLEDACALRSSYEYAERTPVRGEPGTELRFAVHDLLDELQLSAKIRKRGFLDSDLLDDGMIPEVDLHDDF